MPVQRQTRDEKEMGVLGGHSRTSRYSVEQVPRMTPSLIVLSNPRPLRGPEPDDLLPWVIRPFFVFNSVSSQPPLDELHPLPVKKQTREPKYLE